MFKTLLIILIIFFTNYSMAIDLIPCNEREIKGNFTFIVYSNLFINDPETFIVLDKNDNVKIIPFAPVYKYRIFDGLNEKEAIDLINEILYNKAYVNFLKYSAIIDGREILGYEIKPVYFSWIFGVIEPVETIYKKENKIIKIFIRLDPRVERQFYNGGNMHRED